MRNPGVSRGVSLILLTAALCCAQPQRAALREQIVAQERAELDSLKTGDLTAMGYLKRDGRWMCVFSQETAAK